jgi:hypothetical protein
MRLLNQKRHRIHQKGIKLTQKYSANPVFADFYNCGTAVAITYGIANCVWRQRSLEGDNYESN